MAKIFDVDKILIFSLPLLIVLSLSVLEDGRVVTAGLGSGVRGVVSRPPVRRRGGGARCRVARRDGAGRGAPGGGRWPASTPGRRSTRGGRS